MLDLLNTIGVPKFEVGYGNPRSAAACFMRTGQGAFP